MRRRVDANSGRREVSIHEKESSLPTEKQTIGGRSRHYDQRVYFWANFIRDVEISSPHVATPCWRWPSNPNKVNGRCYVRKPGALRGKQTTVYRAAWMYFYGDIPSGMHVCHHCDQKTCGRPSHLFLGTARDNIRDCIAKGRRRNVGSPGERNGNAKLTIVQVAELREKGKLIPRGKHRRRRGSMQALGVEYGITPMMVYYIITGRNWKDA